MVSDRQRLNRVKNMLSGDETAYFDLIEEQLGTRDPDEADRRTRVLWEWELENED